MRNKSYEVFENEQHQFSFLMTVLKTGKNEKDKQRCFAYEKYAECLFFVTTSLSYLKVRHNSVII